MGLRAHTVCLKRNGSPVLRVFVLLAFCLQSFLVQTHIHPFAYTSSTAANSVSAPYDGKAPLDADKCLFCQEYTHAGAYVMPAVAVTLPPSLVVGIVALTAGPLLASKPASHNWMGRAPPRA